MEPGGQLALQFACGSTAGVIAETLTFPVDCTKTRLQLQEHRVRLGSGPHRANTAQSSSVVHRSLWGTARGIVLEEGWRSLYKGLSPALLRQTFKSGFQLTGYKRIRELFVGENGQTGLHHKVLSAMSAGVIAQLVCNPCDVLKVRLQADGMRIHRQGVPQYKGIRSCATALYTEAGVAGFWTGVAPSTQRACIHAGIGLSTYDHTKHLLITYVGLQDVSSTHGATSAISSLCSTVASCPADVVKTRMMNQELKAPKYRGVLHCLGSTVRTEGLLSLWKGFSPYYMRIFPWQFTFFLTYEKLCILVLGETI